MKYEFDVNATGETKSHPIRGGWIEMSDDREAVEQLKVPPHTGWVD